MYKRKAFDHEAETRVLIRASNASRADFGLRVPVDPHRLIETILADPRMPDPVLWAFRRYVTKDLGFSGSFAKSMIYTSKQVHRVGYDDDES